VGTVSMVSRQLPRRDVLVFDGEKLRGREVGRNGASEVGVVESGLPRRIHR
jgi:hypothetical protein